MTSTLGLLSLSYRANRSKGQELDYDVQLGVEEEVEKTLSQQVFLSLESLSNHHLVVGRLCEAMRAC